MKFTPHIILLVVLVCITNSSIVSDVKDNVISILQRSIANYRSMVEQDDKPIKRRIPHFEGKAEDNSDVKHAQEKAQMMKKAKHIDDELFVNADSGVWQSDQYKEKGIYRVDPVLNFLSRRRARDKDSSSISSSSTEEMVSWKDEFKEQWIQKKFEAINSSAPIGDSVNMVAARPWGVPCGDPNQHDMPWGSCMLPMECDPEFRIYRGDYFCGRTKFVCCALQSTTYDMYQGFDVSFADSDMTTDSEELRNRNLDSKERQRKKNHRDKRRRVRARQKRKRLIKRNIRKIIREIKKILSRSYRNGTTARKKKTMMLKKFVKNLKKMYKKDRKSIRDIHEMELLKIDKRLQQRLDQIKGMNKKFISNETFRDIVVNGTVSPKVVRTLIEAYPELLGMLDATRRSNVQKPDYLDYDVEYGEVYY